MENKVTYVKLSDGLQFTLHKVVEFKYKKWDEANNKMLVSDKWQEGYQKRWSCETDKGVLELSNSQLSQCLVAVFSLDNQVADISGAKYSVKTNGKTGKEIRYWINKDYSDDDLPDIPIPEEIPY